MEEHNSAVGLWPGMVLEASQATTAGPSKRGHSRSRGALPAVRQRGGVQLYE